MYEVLQVAWRLLRQSLSADIVGPRFMQRGRMYDSLTDELLIGSGEPQHELRPRAQSKHVQGVHELPKM